MHASHDAHLHRKERREKKSSALRQPDGESVRCAYFFHPSIQPVYQSIQNRVMSATKQQATAILSVYDKTGLLDLAKGLAAKGVRLLGSGGTAKLVREAGLEIG